MAYEGRALPQRDRSGIDDLPAFPSNRGPPMSKFRTFALVNQKGGVGKTTTAINLGTALAAMGKTALVIDLDPQGNASTGLGIERAQRENGTYDVLMGAIPAADAIVTTTIPRLSIIPSTVDLAGAEIELVNAERREHRLTEALSAVAGQNDKNQNDSPPTLILLTLNALVVADALLV